MRPVIPLMFLGLAACATTSQGPADVDDPLGWIEGSWSVENTSSGETVANCEMAQIFRVSSERDEVVLTERTGGDWKLTYQVVRIERDRVLLIVTDEDRLTDSGDPVLWWATFDGRDRFRWRRYDWPRGNFTNQWQRCAG